MTDCYDNVSHSFFRKDFGDSSIYHPTIHSKGPWAADMLHGRVVSGLISYVAEQNLKGRINTSGWQVSRITVDMFRAAPMLPLYVDVNYLRTGRRIQVLEVEININSNGNEKVLVAKGTVIALKKNMDPVEKVWSPDVWDVEYPKDSIICATERGSSSSSDKVPIWDTVNITDGKNEYSSDNRIIRNFGVRRAWIREKMNLVAGESPSQLVRVAQVADIANPLANSSEYGLRYINADITLYLNRDPIGQWIGVETLQHGSTDGIALGAINIYDQEGLVGISTVSGLAQLPST